MKFYINMNRYLIIDEIIKIASTFYGKVFGGYVRDVVVPKLQNPTKKCVFKDVDIWFLDEDCANEFIKEIKKRYDFRLIPGFTLKDNIHYTFDRIQYHLYDDEKIVSWLDIIISDVFPVDDFNVNQLIYYYKDGVEVIDSMSTDYTVDEVVKSINARTIEVLPSYIVKLTNTTTAPVHVGRLNERFTKWDIRYYDIYFPKRLTVEWLQKTFRNNNLPSNSYRTCKESYQSKETIISFEDEDKYNKSTENNCIIS